MQLINIQSLTFKTSSSKGYYLLFDSSYPKVTGDLARIESPVFQFAPAGYCLKWFYHMLGKKFINTN